MQWMPFQRFQIESTSSAAALRERLQSHVAAPRFARRSPGAADFSGKVWKDGFHVRPLLGRQASFVPELHGHFMTTPGGTTIVVEMVPGTAVLAIIAILGGCAGLLIFYNGWRVPLAIAGGLGFSWIISVAGFWIDRGRSRRKLIAAFGQSGNDVAVHGASR
jgi:hypothetical protein